MPSTLRPNSQLRESCSNIVILYYKFTIQEYNINFIHAYPCWTNSHTTESWSKKEFYHAPTIIIIGNRLVVAVVAVTVISNSGSGSRGINL